MFKSVSLHILLLLLIILTGCSFHQLPKTKLSQASLDLDYTFSEKFDSLEVRLKNPLMCPVQITVESDDPALSALLKQHYPIILDELKDTVMMHLNESREEQNISFSAGLGDPDKPINASKVELPYPKGKSYKLIQGYNSKPTHNAPTSRYALDFGLGIGDTICAATSGYVVGVIEGYKYGGENKKWKPYGNFITIYQPETALFTQYVHLVFEGSLVEVGDSVSVGQPIGLSGMTGQTNIEHLHFNCFKPAKDTKGDFASFPLDSIGPYKISQLKRYAAVPNYDY